MVKKLTPDLQLSFDTPTVVGGVSQVVSTCGLSRTLCIGKSSNAHVAALLMRGVDAIGLSDSHAVTTKYAEHLSERFFSGPITAMPFHDSEFNTVIVADCLEYLPTEEMGRALSEIRRVAGRFVWLQVATSQYEQRPRCLTIQNRAWWERRCFQAGFRKHPAYYSINDYESLNNDGPIICILLERIPDAAESAFPLSSLEEERSLHMDMLRDTGTRSDAHVGRYHFASKYIRPGDVVLDAACGLGYGTYTLKGLTAGSAFRGIDGSTSAIAYAKTCFAKEESLTYSEGFLPDCLISIPDNSIDVVICFETLEHVERPEDLLREFHRILSPGGRIISSVPNDWSDETGEDPNPYHFHVYDIPKFSSQLAEHFDLEHLFAQTADRVKIANGKCEWENRPRLLREIPLGDDHSNVESEWLLAVAAKSPIAGRGVPYVERGYSAEECLTGGNALAFARDYENPWLIRCMVAIGSRTANGELRKKWAKETLAVSAPNSPDAGAALCVLAYLTVAREITLDIDLSDAIHRYINFPASDNPNALRWKVSLAFAHAMMALSNGDRTSAKALFQWILEADAGSYSITLLTKPAEAGYLLGLLEAADGNISIARQIWRQTAFELQKAMGEYFSASTLKSAAFILRETSTVMLFCGRILAAERHSANFQIAPAAFFANAVNDYISEIERLTAFALKLEGRLFENAAEGTADVRSLKETSSLQAAQLDELRKYVLALEESRNEQKAQLAELRQYTADLEESRAILIKKSKKQ